MKQSINVNEHHFSLASAWSFVESADSFIRYQVNQKIAASQYHSINLDTSIDIDNWLVIHAVIQGQKGPEIVLWIIKGQQSRIRFSNSTKTLVSPLIRCFYGVPMAVQPC